MSIKVTAEVWRSSRHKGSELLVLLAIADNADDEHRLAWPSLDYLAEKTRLSRRQVIRVLQTLADSREITIQERRRADGKQRTSVYVICDYAQGDKLSLGNGVTSAAPNGVTSMSPRTRLNNLVKRESSKNEPSDSEVRRLRTSPFPHALHLPNDTTPLAFEGWFFTVTEAQIDAWRPAFPAVDILTIVKRAHSWIDANPEHAKRSATGWKRWLVRVWFGRNQDRSGNPTLNGKPEGQTLQQRMDMHMATLAAARHDGRIP